MLRPRKLAESAIASKGALHAEKSAVAMESACVRTLTALAAGNICLAKECRNHESDDKRREDNLGRDTQR